MSVIISGIWCKSKLDFDKHVRQNQYQHVISYYDIHLKLHKSDPDNTEPSDLLISLQIQRLFKAIHMAPQTGQVVNIAFLFKHLDQETVDNFRSYMRSLFLEDHTVDLIIIDRCDYPKKGVLSKFDTVKFIDYD